MAEARFRIYNLAGNPFIVALADRQCGRNKKVISRGIDAVFEIEGQPAHDVVPSAYISLKAKAYMHEIDGEEITVQTLAKSLLDPKAELRYVVAGTQDLAEVLLEVFKGITTRGRRSRAEREFAPLHDASLEQAASSNAR